MKITFTAVENHIIGDGAMRITKSGGPLTSTLGEDPLENGNHPFFACIMPDKSKLECDRNAAQQLLAKMEALPGFKNAKWQQALRSALEQN